MIEKLNYTTDKDGFEDKTRILFNKIDEIIGVLNEMDLDRYAEKVLKDPRLDTIIRDKLTNKDE